MKKVVGHSWLGMVVVAVLMTQVGSVHAQEPGGNWLANQGFENGTWYFQDSVPEAQVPDGWWAYWRESPPAGLVLPSNCPRAEDTGCYWARPEFQPVNGQLYPDRVHSRRWAQKYFSAGRMHEAGLLQHVDDLPPGSRLRFSVWMQAWMCHDQAACQGGRRSDAPARMHLQVGIDPNGGWDPWSDKIIWSSEGEAFDEWTLFQVEAQLSPYSSSMTVFTRSRAEWDWARINNDIYVDDARLEVVSEEAGALQTSSTLTTAGFITHTVASGETLLGIALRYGVSPEQLVEINELPADFDLAAGRALWVPHSGTQTNTRAPIPELAPSFATFTETVEMPTNHKTRNASLIGKQDVGLIAALIVSALALVGAIRFIQGVSKQN